MDKNASSFEDLKQVLRHIRNPEELNDHPWTRSLFVQQALQTTPRLAHVRPGQQWKSRWCRHGGKV